MSKDLSHSTRLRQRTAAAADAPELTADVVARYQAIYREAMAAWRCSRWEEPPPSAARAAAGDAAGPPRKRPRRTKNREGNPTFLAKAMDALKAIREIKDLDAQRQDGPVDPAAVKVEDLSGMSDAQLCALEAGLREQCQLESRPDTM